MPADTVIQVGDGLIVRIGERWQATHHNRAASFEDPRDAGRWLGSALSRYGSGADLEAMQAVIMGGVQVVAEAMHSRSSVADSTAAAE